MSSDANPLEETCLCQGFVPKEHRLDFDQQLPDQKTGKLKWKTVIRFHMDCPEHGVKVCPEA